MISDNKAMNSSLEDIVRILGKQTIKGVHEVCYDIARKKNLLKFRKFIEKAPHFISTPKRTEILEGIITRLREKESPGVIIYGGYGSGKTIIMDIISKLCEENKRIKDKKFDMLQYGDKEIDCFTVSLEESPVPSDFLFCIFESFVEASENIQEQDLINIFNSNKDDLTIEDVSKTISKKQKERYLEIFDSPRSLRDISKVVKSLPAAEACRTVEWFSIHYKKVENKYPAIYIDEFEQMIRQVEPGETTRLKLIIQRMIRSAVTGFKHYDEPPYILFANTLALDELTKNFQAERDLADRIRESISYNVDLSPLETKSLFMDLYRLYLTPILEERKDDQEVMEWYNKIKKSSQEDKEYVYPFTEEALDYVIRREILEHGEGEKEDEIIIRAFRDYKNILTEYLELWSGESLIDLEYLYKNGDKVKKNIGYLEKADIKKLPGKQKIEDTIDLKYSNISNIHKRVLKSIAKTGILDYSKSPVYFDQGEIESEANKVEITLSDEEIDKFINQAIAQDYFKCENGRLVFYPEKLIVESSVEGPKKSSEVVRETVEKYNLENKSLINLWKEAIENELNPEMIDRIKEGNGRYLIFDVKEKFYYADKIYMAISSNNEPPVELKEEINSKALNIVINLGEPKETEEFAKFKVFERNDRASDLIENIERKLNNQIYKQSENDSNNRLIKDIIESFQNRSDFRIYTLFLKLSLAKLAGYDMPPAVNDRIAGRGTLSILDFLRHQLKNPKSYLREKLGLKGEYKGKDIMDFIYGIKHCKQEKSLLFNNPNLTNINVISFQRVQQSKRAGKDFEKEVLEKFSKEPFLKEKNGDYKLIPEYSARTSEIIEIIEEEIGDKKKVDFNRLYKLIFGTTEIQNVGKAMVYLILVLEDYWDNWVLKDIDKLVVKPELVLEYKKNKLKEKAKKTIKKEVITNLVTQENNKKIKELKQKYNEIDNIQKSERLKSLEEMFDKRIEVNYDIMEEKLKKVIANDVFADTKIADYVNSLRPLSELTSSLLYLIKNDLETLLDNIIVIGHLLELKFELDEKIKKLNGLGKCDLSPNDNFDDYLKEINEFMSTNNLEKNISHANVAQDIDDYIEGDLELEKLYDLLDKTRYSIVPSFENKKEKISTEIENLNSLLQEAKEIYEISRERCLKNINNQKDKLDNLQRQLPDREEVWVKRGKKYLNSCEAELKKNIDSFSKENYENYWDEWEKSKQNIEKKVIDEEDIKDKLKEYNIDVKIDEIFEANGEIYDLFNEISEKEFNQVIEALDLSSETSKKICCNLIKLRLFSRGDDVK